MRLHSAVGFSALVGAVLFSGGAHAATLQVKSSFGGGDGYLAPGDRPYLQNDNLQRGIAFNPATGNLLLVSRTGAPANVLVLDGTTGADVGTLDVNPAVITGGTFAGNMIAAAEDGAIYMANLTTNATTSPFKVYRWANEAAAPTLAYSGAPLAGARLGDSLDAIGSGANTQLAAGYNTNGGVNNAFALLTTADGASYGATNVTATGVAAGDFRFGITFQDADTVIGKSTATGRVVDFTGGSGTLSASFALDSQSINPMDFAIVGGKPLLATIEASGSVLALGARLFVYDMTDPTMPVQVGVLSAQPGASNANANGTGQVRFGAISGGNATIYALSTNNGIQAFELTNVPEPGGCVLAAGLAGLLAARRRRLD